ncbi:MAG: UbiA family prenyltransferase [Bacteriovoracaceae bacterium]
MGKWLTFTRERFKPFEYLPLIILFVGVNYLFSHALSGLSLPVWQILILGVLGFLFFFRMRLFDEIKDYEVDLVINPTRPLARGLIKVPEVKKMILFIILLELVLVRSFGLLPMLLYIASIFYSLLMYEEFFIGDWLRPKLTTYAMSHTIVVAMLAFTMIAANLGYTVFESKATDIFVLSHWFVFNLFEFARKTFDPHEERENVPSYSKIFTLKGAYLLSASQVFLALVFLFQLRALFTVRWLLVLGAVYVLCLLPHVLNLKSLPAKSFRNLSTIYMALHFVLLFILLWS